MMQGFPDLNVEGLTDQDLRRLSGDTITVPAVSAVLLTVWANVRPREVMGKRPKIADAFRRASEVVHDGFDDTVAKGRAPDCPVWVHERNAVLPGSSTDTDCLKKLIRLGESAAPTEVAGF